MMLLRRKKKRNVSDLPEKLKSSHSSSSLVVCCLLLLTLCFPQSDRTKKRKRTTKCSIHKLDFSETLNQPERKIQSSFSRFLGKEVLHSCSYFPTTSHEFDFTMGLVLHVWFYYNLLNPFHIGSLLLCHTRTTDYTPGCYSMKSLPLIKRSLL